MRKVLGILSVAALLILAFAIPAGAGHDRPFKGTVQGGVNVAPNSSCPIALETLSFGVGPASHLGKTAMSSVHCTPEVDLISGGAMTLEAANGDLVSISYSGTAPFPTPSTEVIVADVDFVITGGDGRFRDATGGGDMTVYIIFPGDFDPANFPWQATWVWSGTINY